MKQQVLSFLLSVALLTCAGLGPARADGSLFRGRGTVGLDRGPLFRVSQGAPPPSNPAALPAPPQTAPAPTAENDEEASAKAEEAQSNESVTKKGWFWGAVVGVVAVAVIILIATNQSSSPPGSTLGNMEAFRSH